MKNSQLSADQACQWIVKFQENEARRRGFMFRFISRSLQLLTLGNAGGIGFICGLFPPGSEQGWQHVLLLSTVICFILGVLSSVITVLVVTFIVIKEAHLAECSLREFLTDKKSWEDVLCAVDRPACRLAPVAAMCGVLGASFLVLGVLLTLGQLAIFY